MSYDFSTHKLVIIDDLIFTKITKIDYNYWAAVLWLHKPVKQQFPFMSTQACFANISPMILICASLKKKTSKSTWDIVLIKIGWQKDQSGLDFWPPKSNQFVPHQSLLASLFISQQNAKHGIHGSVPHMRLKIASFTPTVPVIFPEDNLWTDGIHSYSRSCLRFLLPWY